MAEDSSRSSHRIIEFSPEAARDRNVISIYTEQEWGIRQADNYDDFLRSVILALAENPTLAPLSLGRRDTPVYVARWKNAKQGHRIFFRETDPGILVLRIRHTARDWPGDLGTD